MRLFLENSHKELILKMLEELTSHLPAVGSQDSPAKALVMREQDKDSRTTPSPGCSLNSCEFCLKLKKATIDPRSCSLRMFEDCLPHKKGWISTKCSLKWTETGTMQNGWCLTLPTLGLPSPERECTLSDILEEEVESKFFLSPEVANRLVVNLV